MDELVRPEAPITDYVTRYSGITPAMMQGVTTSLADVQVLAAALDCQPCRKVSGFAPCMAKHRRKASSTSSQVHSCSARSAACSWTEACLADCSLASPVLRFLATLPDR